MVFAFSLQETEQRVFRCNHEMQIDGPCHAQGKAYAQA